MGHGEAACWTRSSRLSITYVCDDTKSKAAAAARMEGAMAVRKRGELLGLLRPYLQVEPWLQASKYVAAVASDVPKRNGWTNAQRAGDWAPQRQRTPVRTERT